MTTTQPGRRGPRIRAAGATAVLLTLAVTGCGSGSTQAVGNSAATQAPATRRSTPTAPPLTVRAAGRSHGVVPFGRPVVLTASHPVTAVTVTAADGTPVPGSLSADGRTWTSGSPIPAGTRWSWSADGSGQTVAGATTSAPATAVVRATANIGPGRVVGVAAPIVVLFHAKVTDKATVQRHLRVYLRPDGSHGPWRPADGSWAWLPDTAPDSTAHFRTRRYWPAHSQVKVVLPLANLDWGGGVTGRQNLEWTFRIGRSQVVEADARKHDIVIYRDGRHVATYPASYGLTSQLNRNTRSGISIVTDKYRNIEMKSELFNYDLMEHWAVRINNNGEFIHANPETVRWQGRKNVSHGCINLSTANARAYFKSAIYGDPVEVTGTRTKLSDSRTELYDWALSWKQWTAMSALH